MENNNPEGWINRYHPDSYERLHNINWQNTKILSTYIMESYDVEK